MNLANHIIGLSLYFQMVWQNLLIQRIRKLRESVAPSIRQISWKEKYGKQNVGKKRGRVSKQHNLVHGEGQIDLEHGEEEENDDPQEHGQGQSKRQKVNVTSESSESESTRFSAI